MNKTTLPNFEIVKKLGYVILALAIFFIFFIDYFLVMRLQLKAISSSGRKASELAKVIKESHANYKKIHTFKAEAVTLQEKLHKVEKSILPTEDMDAIADYVSQLASKHEIQINQIAPVAESEAKALKSNQGEYLGLPIAVDAEGSYHNIGLFFSSIESGETCMNIQSFQIAQNPRSTKKHILKMIVTVFVLKKE